MSSSTMWIPNKKTVAISFLATVGGCSCLIKDVYSGTPYDLSITAKDKIIIVTGANTGIGKETVRNLANRGAKVYMACRDLQKCEETRKEIVIETSNRYVYCRPCDLSSFQSIRSFVKTFENEQSHLDILINNAGVMRCPKSLTKEGIEMQLGVNHMGHFLLTNLLLDKLKKSAAGRVVVVSSGAHKRGDINKQDLNSDISYDPGDAYNQSKLANLLFTAELSNRLLDSKVTANAVHPGWVDTDIMRNMSVTRGFTGTILYPLIWPFIKTPRMGAQTSIYVALDPKLENVTGHYFVDCKNTEPSKKSKDLELARWLWLVSEKWTQLRA